MAKLLYISFGYEPFWSGGMVKNQLGLMKNLMSIGHKVTYFTACRYDFKKSVYLSGKKVNGIETIEMVNSPNLYDPYCYRTNPKSHCTDSRIERLTRDVVEMVNPDLVHISALTMHCASVIEVLKKYSLPIVKTIHNFWDVCPKGDLMFNDESSCTDFDGGRKCLVCLSKYEKRHIPTIHRIKGSIFYEYYFPLIRKIGWLKTYIPKSREKKTISSTEYSAAQYAGRRKCFVDMLNRCDIIHTTSKNIAEKMVKYGIRPQIIRTVPLSAEGLAEIKPKSDFVPRYPIIFGYRGKLHVRKGIQILLSAFSRLDQKKCKLVIYGDGDLSLLHSYNRKEVNVDYRGTYRKNQINRVLKEIDVGVVPSIWEEIFGIVGLEYINARIPVIGSNIGGISEWLKNGENGFLFDPSNSNELFKIMSNFVSDPSLITQLQKKIRPWRNAATYAREISELYRSIKTG